MDILPITLRFAAHREGVASSTPHHLPHSFSDGGKGLPPAILTRDPRPHDATYYLLLITYYLSKVIRLVFSGKTALALLLLAAFLTGCRAKPGHSIEPLPQFGAVEATNAFQQTERFVALGARHAGSEGAERAAHYLRDTLVAMGLTDVRLESFADETPHGPRNFHNVVAEIAAAQPSAPRIVLLSHFDTKSGVSGDTAETPFVGANDGGSSTGLLLALAQAFIKSRDTLPCHVMLAFLDGEECALAYSDRDGLHGSKYLARQMRQQRLPVRAVILADMIGDRDLNIQIPRNGTPELRLLALQCAQRLGLGDKVALGSGNVLDDHVPFLDAGFPAIDLIDFHFGSAPGRNDYWHTMEDTMDKLAVESFAVTGRLITAMMAELVQ